MAVASRERWCGGGGEEKHATTYWANGSTGAVAGGSQCGMLGRKSVVGKMTHFHVHDDPSQKKTRARFCSKTSMLDTCFSAPEHVRVSAPVEWFKFKNNRFTIMSCGPVGVTDCALTLTSKILGSNPDKNLSFFPAKNKPCKQKINNASKCNLVFPFSMARLKVYRQYRQYRQ